MWWQDETAAGASGASEVGTVHEKDPLRVLARFASRMFMHSFVITMLDNCLKYSLDPPSKQIDNLFVGELVFIHLTES